MNVCEVKEGRCNQSNYHNQSFIRWAPMLCRRQHKQKDNNSCSGMYVHNMYSIFILRVACQTAGLYWRYCKLTKISWHISEACVWRGGRIQVWRMMHGMRIWECCFMSKEHSHSVSGANANVCLNEKLRTLHHRVRLSSGTCIFFNSKLPCQFQRSTSTCTFIPLWTKSK